MISFPLPIDSYDFSNCSDKEIFFINDERLKMFLVTVKDSEKEITPLIINATANEIKKIINPFELKLIDQDAYKIDFNNQVISLANNFKDKSIKVSNSIITNNFKPRPRASLAAEVQRKLSYICHGRCMFEGCGEELDIDNLTGEKGNYKNFAHIIAASSNGPRGNKEESKKYENDPENFLVLCDKHHRLIDTIASGLYPVARLHSMKNIFIQRANKCLESLAYSQAIVCTVVWPISSNSVAIPTKQEIAKAANFLHLQTNSTNDYTEDGNSISIPAEIRWSILSNNLNLIEEKIKAFYSSNKKILLFALGPTAAMIGLGAKLGNKNLLIPVPRLRQSGWGWLSQEESPVFQIECGKNKTDEVVLEVFLTEIPKCVEPPNLQDCQHIRICLANPDNACISTVEASDSFMRFMYDLFTNKLRQYKKIHILACASNVACIQLGRAIEYIHSSIILYDFCANKNHTYWIPRLSINANDKQIIIKSINNVQEKV